MKIYTAYLQAAELAERLLRLHYAEQYEGYSEFYRRRVREQINTLDVACSEFIEDPHNDTNSGSSGPDNAGGRQAVGGGGEIAEKASELAAPQPA